MKRTYLDASVLIAVARGQSDVALRAIEILDDPEREFVASIFLELELLPKPRYHQRDEEVQFYEEFLASVVQTASVTDAFLADALQEACLCGMGAIDALHITAAAVLDCAEFVTAEGLSKPIHRTKRVKKFPFALLARTC